MGSSFAKELAELAAEIEATNQLADRSWKASGLPFDQWSLLMRAERSVTGRLHIHSPEHVPVAKALAERGLGEYLPPAELGARAFFEINDQGERIAAL
jgi:hypothetical protein